MTGFNFGAMVSQENQVKQIPIDMLVPYHNHQFTLYEGERQDDMVESIRQNGVITPIVVRPLEDEDKYEILIGHNRWNCSKIVGLETVPGIIKEHLTDEEAEIYVIESNLIQRGFNDLKISEQAKVLALRYESMFSQGKRNDIINELMALESQGKGTTIPKMKTRQNSRELVGEEYGLSRNTVARLLRINRLYDGIKVWVDEKRISIRAGVELSYMDIGQQERLYKLNTNPQTGEMNCKISETQAKSLRETAEKAIAASTDIGLREVSDILAPTKEKPISKSVKVNQDTYTKYFAEKDKDEISNIIERALEMYFNSLE